MNGKAYSKEEVESILDAYFNENKSVDVIAATFGRTRQAIRNVVMRNKSSLPNKQRVPVADDASVYVDAAQPTPVKQTTPVKQMLSPREMIKHLYSLGYRIKDNQLVVLVEQKVNIKDIING